VFDFRQALPHIKAAMDTLQAQKEERELASVYLQMSRAQSYLGNLREAERFASEGLRLAEQGGLTTHVADGHWHLAWVHTLSGRSDADLYYENGIKIAEECGDLGRAIPAFSGRAVYYYSRGEYARALETTEHGLKISEEVGNRVRIAMCRWWLARLHFMAGDWGAALSFSQQYLAMSEAFPAAIEGMKSLAAFIRGEFGDALEWMRKAVAEAERRREVSSLGLAVDGVAALAIRMGLHAQARGLLDEYLPRFTQMGLFWPAYLHPLAAEAALGLGDVDSAVEHCQRAEAYLPLGLKPAQARLLRVQGLVAAARGRPDEAIRLIHEAANLYGAIGQPYDRARCLEDLAAGLGRRDADGDQVAATNAMQEALGIYQKLGAEFEVRRI
ncbi:MAG: tetratricopeptide repeat protein, partial [bacterium]